MAITLNTNEIFGSLSNMIIGQFVFTDNIKGTYDSLVNRAKVDGSLFGDQYLYYATDALRSYKFTPDSEEQLNVLKTFRPKAPEVQAIVLDNFRQIPLTIDNYFSKRAFSTEGAFADFNATMLGWLRDTRAIIDSTEFNAYVGTAATEIGEQTVVIDGSQAEDEGHFAQKVAQEIANVLTKLKDVSKDYNDYGFYRSYDEDDLIIVWNAEYVNKIKKYDLPTIFHKEGLMDKFDEKNVLPAKYFGTVQATNEPDAYSRALVELDYTIAGSADPIHVFAGESVPTGATVIAEKGEIKLYSTAGDNTICKIIHKNSIPYMSAFETETMFFNPRNLSENHYLTFGRNTLQYLKNYPMITVKSV